MSKQRKLHIINNEKTGEVIIGKFDKVFQNDYYQLFFDSQTGLEVLQGINGHADPQQLVYPSLIDCGIMGHCDNHCAFCYQGNKTEPNMTIENFKRIVEESSPYTNQIALGGRGDPNLHENFEEILKLCRINNIIPNYTTSGNNLTQRQVDITKEYAGAVAVSDYDNDFTYKAIEMFQNVGMKTNIHFLLTGFSFNDSIRILEGDDIWHKKIDIEKLNALVFLLFKPQGNGKDKTDWILTSEQLKILSTRVPISKSIFRIGLDSCSVNLIKEDMKLTTIQDMSMSTCDGAKKTMYISPDMKAVPCSFADLDIWGSSIENKTIEEVWKDEKFELFRQLLYTNGQTCPLGF